MLTVIDDAAIRGAAFELDRASLLAGINGLDGRSAEAIEGFRAAIAGFTGLGLSFDTALATIDLASALPGSDRSSPEIDGWIDSARETLERLGARPFLDRLADALSADGDRTAARARRATATVSSEAG